MTGIITTPMLSPQGAFITELKADAAVASLVGTRVRGPDPGSSNADDEGDARGPGEYVAFITTVMLDDPPHRSLPIQTATIGVNCYGVTYQHASAIWGAVISAVHKVSVRMKSSGQGFYLSIVDSGGEQDRDPRTNQPVVRGIVRVIATAQAVT